MTTQGLPMWPDDDLGCETCDHRSSSHAYRTSTKRNDGHCLVRNCPCSGEDN